ncbi:MULTISPECIES: DUF2335 domain-containing protein [unclassified Rhodanobacter]|uniref:DUF2335 domain-containing protein n=1 Tax=unclassified Rhodanobacter TaxID=2621553 RepID=UPI0009EF1A13|nr:MULTISPECIES: DUF2335 domain-containing protein [unclassified Rhodanobacter]
MMNSEIATPDNDPKNAPTKLPPVPPELQRLDPKAFQAAKQYFLQVAVHSGPLPSPQQLAEYEQASPGLALEIVGMAKSEQITRHHCMRSEVDAIKRGQLCAIAAFALAMGATCFLAYVGAYIAAGSIGGTAITVFGGAFILARHFSAKQEQGQQVKPATSASKKSKVRR